jgi:predicted esterase
MNIIKETIKVQRTARVYTLGETPTSDGVLMVALHGYGQLAYNFIQHFKVLVEEFPIRIVAPEGLSRFYLDEQYRRVGASWMTREDRIEEIHDQIDYLNTVLERELSRFTGSLPAIHVLGFSQGTATAWRWVASTHLQIEQMILWAGTIPEEPNERLSPKKIKLVLGDSDPYFVGSKRDAYLNVLTKLQLSDRLLTFDGDHRMDSWTLHRIYSEYFNLL